MIDRQTIIDMIWKLHKKIESCPPSNNSLFPGKAGQVIYYLSLGQTFENADILDKAINYVAELIDDDECLNSVADSSFATGASGIAYSLSAAVNARLVEMDLDEGLEELDTALTEKAISLTQRNDLDVLNGASGILHYFNNRQSSVAVLANQKNISDAICNRQLKKEQLGWFVNINGEIDTGLSHGNVGILLALLDNLSTNDDERLRDTITAGINFLLSLETSPAPDKDEFNYFPFFITNDNQQVSNQRLAWCYGDLNVLVLLYRAAKLMNNEQWRAKADTIAASIVLRRDQKATLITDSHFCHGSAGLVRIYDYLSKLSGNPIFTDSRDFWLQQTMLFLDRELSENYYAGKESDWLEGLTGINMTLLSCISSKELDWSRSLLI